MSPLEARLGRRDVVKALLDERGEMLVVAGLGSSAWDCAAAGDHPLTFYLWGAMGSALPIGLGLALARPERRVLVITGDGEMLMGMGSLATAGAQNTANLAVVVLDNERYGETGLQQTHTARGVDLAGMARAAGFAETCTVAAEGELGAALQLARAAPGPVFVAVKVSAEKDPLVLPLRDGVEIKNRFRRALLGDAAFV